VLAAAHSSVTRCERDEGVPAAWLVVVLQSSARMAGSTPVYAHAQDETCAPGLPECADITSRRVRLLVYEARLGDTKIAESHAVTLP
jgi:hypothetical protein